MKVVVGSETVDLGTTEIAPTIGIIDYSRRETDDFGVTTVVERGFARRLSTRFMVPTDAVDALQLRLAALRATSAQWIADDRFAWLKPVGFYKDFEVDLAVPPASFCTLTIEGLAETSGAADPGGDPAPDGQSSTLRLLQPVTVTESVLVSSSVAEADYPTWAADTTYALGNRVIRAHRIFESAAAGNVGNDPTGTSGKWLDIGPTNRWAMFDQALGSETEASNSIAVTLAPGAAQGVALLDVIADTVRVQAPGGYDRTLSVVGGAATFLDLTGASGQVTVTITGSGTVSVGTLLVGKLVALGITEASPTAGITDFSRKEVDDFGGVTIVQRAWAKRMTARALIRTDALDMVADRIASVRATPSLWIGQDGLNSLTIYGFFKDFSIEVGAATSKLSLSIEGLSTAGKVEPLKASTDWPDVGDPLGTKPDDNATDGAPAGSNVGGVKQPDGSQSGGRPAEEVLAHIDINAQAILEEALRQDDFVQVVDARTLIEGQPVGVQFLAFKNEQVEENAALASTLALIGAKTADGTAWVLDLQSVRVDETKTLAERLEEVGLSEADVDAKITEYDAVVSDRLGKVEATRTIAIDINGNVVGTQLVGSQSGPGSLNLINADLRMGTGRQIFNNGTFMKIQGVGFGANSDLITWYGPTMAIGDCSRANAISYETIDGDARFGGSLSAGKFKNDASSTLINADASLTLGSFHSDGDVISIIFSYSFQRSYVCNAGTGGISGNGSATLELRSVDASGPLLTNLTANETERLVIVDGDPSVDDRVIWAMAGSVTINWTAGVTDFAQLFARIVSRAQPTLLGQNIRQSSIRQTITLVAVES